MRNAHPTRLGFWIPSALSIEQIHYGLYSCSGWRGIGGEVEENSLPGKEPGARLTAALAVGNVGTLIYNSGRFKVMIPLVVERLINKLSNLDLSLRFHDLKTDWHGKNQNGVDWHVYKGDARQILESLPDNTYNCIVTSPPYYCLRNYGVDGQIGQEETVQGYVDAISSVMDEARRVLRQDGVLFLNIGDTYYSGKGESQGEDRKSRKRRFGLRPVDKSGGLGIGIRPKGIIGIPWRVAIEMSKRDWILRSPIIWHRTYRLPEAVKDRPRRSYEHVFMFVKERKYYFNRQSLIEQKIEEDLWSIPARPKATDGIDTAPFPDELVKRCLDIGCPENGSVLDPFAGAGTTLRVAVKSGRSATGIDLNPVFCQYMVDELVRL